MASWTIRLPTLTQFNAFLEKKGLLESEDVRIHRLGSLASAVAGRVVTTTLSLSIVEKSTISDKPVEFSYFVASLVRCYSLYNMNLSTEIKNVLAELDKNQPQQGAMPDTAEQGLANKKYWISVYYAILPHIPYAKRENSYDAIIGYFINFNP